MSGIIYEWFENFGYDSQNTHKVIFLEMVPWLLTSL